jgi:hypothetical protein
MTRLRIAASVFALAVTTAAVLAVAGSAAPGKEAQVLGSADVSLADPVLEELAIASMASSTDAGTQHYGPFASSSPDSGTCGNDWAQDTFDRFFTVKQNPDGTYRVYEQFKNGSFITTEPPTGLFFSPGACDSSDGTPPALLVAGIVGTMHGYLTFTVMGSEDPDASCAGTPSPCETTSGFFTEFFPGALVTTDAYFFHYAGYDGANKALVIHEWKNASCNRGGNHGDIATTTVGVVVPFPVDVCP